MADDDTIRIHFICEATDGNSPPESLIHDIAHRLVEPAIPGNIHYHLDRGDFSSEPGTLDHYTIDMMASDDLVIADLSSLGNTSYFLLGARAHKGLPIIYISDKTSPLPADFQHGLVIRYSRENPEASVNDLRIEIERALAHDAAPPIPQVELPPLPFRERRLELANRIEATAEVIRSLRINSVSESVDELVAIAEQLKELPDENSPSRLQEAGDKALAVLFRLLDELSGQTGARLSITGAIALIVGGSGASGTVAFGAGLAFWYGKSAFTKFIDAWGRRNTSRSKSSKK